MRERVESATGVPLSDVRVHADAGAAERSSELGAQAFTVGREVFLGSGGADAVLLAHELTHAAQQAKRVVPPGLLDVNATEGYAEREADSVARLALAGRAARVTGLGASVARAPVSDYGAKRELTIARADMETEQMHVPGLDRLAAIYHPVHINPVLDRFKKDAEERDAVYDVAWNVRPLRLGRTVEKLVSVPARGPAAPLLYKFTFTPKDAKDKKGKDKLDIKFEVAGAGAAIVTPPAATGMRRPVDLVFEAAGVDLDHLEKHPDEAQQLYGWIATQKADAYDQVLRTTGMVRAGKASRKHASSLRVKKEAGTADIHVELLNELGEKSPAADYRRDYSEYLIAEAQKTGDPGQTTKPDKLGAATGIAAFPEDERFSVRFFAYSTFESRKDSPGMRDAESKGIVNIAGSTKQVLVKVTVAPSAKKKTFDMDVQRIGELGKDVEIDPEKVKPDIARAAGFPTAGGAAAITAFLANRYKALAAVSGKTPVEVTVAANKLLGVKAKTPSFFLANYGVSVLDAASAATRLQTVNGAAVEQTEDMKDFTGGELVTLELALEKVGDPLLAKLAGTAFTRQTSEIVDHGSKAAPRFTTSTKHSGITWTRTGPSDRTVIIFDTARGSDAESFTGTTKQDVLPAVDVTFLHEIGHSIDDVTKARAAFNKKFGKLRAFTDYARTDPGKEAFEEAFAIFHADPEWMKVNHRQVFDWFTKLAEAGKAP